MLSLLFINISHYSKKIRNKHELLSFNHSVDKTKRSVELHKRREQSVLILTLSTLSRAGYSGR